MKRLLILTLCLLLPAAAQAQYVQGYQRQNGTYVQGYYRSAPDNTTYNNYSTRGNVNPYTGQPGTVNPVNTYQNRGYNPYSGARSFEQKVD